MPDRLESVMMSIEHFTQKIKLFGLSMAVGRPLAHLFLLVLGCFCLIMALLRLSAIERLHKPISLLSGYYMLNEPRGGFYEASKTGTKYYFPWCGQALALKPSKQAWFGSRQAAERAGYSPARNCSGL